jgi:predicted P-loop ATPase
MKTTRSKIKKEDLKKGVIASIDSNRQIKISTSEPCNVIEPYIQSIRRNQVTLALEKNGSPLTEQHVNSMWLDIKRANGGVKNLNKELLDIYLNSKEVDEFHPIREFFEDHKDSHPEGFIDALHATIQPYDARSLHFLKCWLVGMVASVYEHYNVLMLVFTGAKNTGKTEFFRRLLPDELKRYFTQSKFDQGKDSEALMCEFLLILNDELDGMHQKEAKTFRNFISQNQYTYRPPYGKQNITRKRLATICGTSNDSAIIQDPENNRRMVPVKVESIDHKAYNSIDKRSLLMEAYHLFKDGFDWNLKQEDIGILEEMCEGYEISNLETELLNKYFEASEGGLQMSASEILSQISIKSGIKNLSLQKLGKALNRFGFPRKSIKRAGCIIPIKVYCLHEAASVQSSSNVPEESHPF